MKLREILANYANLDDDYLIFAEADPVWTCDSEAMLIPYSEDLGTSLEVEGIEMRYVLEVYLVKEVMEDWCEWRNCLGPTLEQICRVIIYYAENDAFPED